MNINNGEQFTLIDDLTVWGDCPEPHTPVTLLAGTVVSFPRWIRVKDDPWAGVEVVETYRGGRYRVMTNAALRAVAPNYLAAL